MASALAGGLVLGDCWTQVGLKTMDCASAPGCDPGIAQSTIGITRARQLALAIRLNSSRRASSLNPFFITLAPSATSLPSMPRGPSMMDHLTKSFGKCGSGRLLLRVGGVVSQEQRREAKGARVKFR